MSRTRRTRTRGNISTTAIPRMRFKLSPPTITPRPLQSLLRLYEDRRTWHPQRAFRPATSFIGRTQLKISPQRPARRGFSKLSVPLSPNVSFVRPDKVLVCVRRHIRREVIHALNHAGRGGQRKPRPSHYSSVHC